MNMTATEIQLKMKELEARFQRDVVDPIMAPLVDRMFNLLAEQGIMVGNLHIPNLLWWEEVLRWNPCNTFVAYPSVQFRIEPDIYL